MEAARLVDPPADDVQATPRARTPIDGVNVAGFVRAELGIGEAARLLIGALRAADIPYSTVEYRNTVNRKQSSFRDFGSGPAAYATNIVCVNADGLPHFAAYHVAPSFFHDRYTIGLWFWEVEEFPEWMRRSADLLDEIWVASRHAADAIAPVVDKPVHVLPLPIVPPPTPAAPAADLGLPEGFRFLFIFDFNSIFERKNPVELVEAFAAAFGDDDGVHLVVKTINGEHQPAARERLATAATGRPNVHLLEDYLDSTQMQGLMAASDAYVSLHRAEGFGLTMGEMMALGKPVIATGYSGNLEFMTDRNSYLVPYELAAIPEGCDPYPAGAHWAQPDLEEAARLMRHVFSDREEAAARGARAALDIREHRAPEVAAEFLLTRLANCGAPSPKPPPHLLLATPAGKPMPPVDPPTPEPIAEVARVLELVRSAPPLSRAWPLRFVQRIALRTVRPWVEHQQELALALARVVHQLEWFPAYSAAIDRLDPLASVLFGRVDTLLDRMLEVEATSAQTSVRLETLDNELHARPFMTAPFLVETKDGRRTFGYDGAAPAPETYIEFENVFRGSEKLIQSRQRRYVELIAGRAPVVDLGCGRGEFLDLLREAGVAATGVDADRGMVERSRAKGHDVEHGDVLEFLARHDEQSLGALFSAQVIEHLHPDALLRLFRHAERTLVHGGVFIAETVNPHSLRAAKAFWVDPTHKAPIFPEVAVVLCRIAGFERAQVLFPLGSGELEHDLRTQGEYAVIATKGQPR